MSEERMTLSTEGFQFIGKMTASITHEIKNALAVIRENAGLMEDLIDMGERKGDLDPSRIRNLAGKIGDYAMKADGIVQNMNRFGHSMDAPDAELDLGETVALLVALAGRLASMRGVTLEVRPPDAPVWIQTHPLFLETLLWGMLDVAMDAAGTDKRLVLSLEQVETGGGRLRVSGVEADTGLKALGSPSEGFEAMQRLLGAEVSCSAPGAEMTLRLPGKLAG